MSILIRNALIVTQNHRRNIAKGNILIEKDKISYIGKKEFGADTIIDAHNMAAMPGMINTHTHVAMSRFKGALDDINLDSFLERTFKLDASRTSADIFESSVIGMNELIDSGTTSFLDLYYSEDIIAKAAQKTGIRAFLSWVTLDRKFTTQKGDPLRNAERFVKKFKSSGLVSPSIGVQGVYVASDETLAKAKELAKKYKVIIHIHLAETKKEVDDYINEKGESPVEHLYKTSFLDSNVVAAHCVWLSEPEIKMLAKSKASVSWNQVSNSKLASGSARIKEMLDNGINVTIGTDSNGSNNSLSMFEAMKFSALSVKNLYNNAAVMNAQKIFDMVTVNAAMALHRNDIGSIEKGKKADIVLLDIAKPNMRPSNEKNIINNIVYSANPSNVCHVIINGNIVK